MPKRLFDPSIDQNNIKFYQGLKWIALLTRKEIEKLDTDELLNYYIWELPKKNRTYDKTSLFNILRMCKNTLDMIDTLHVKAIIGNRI